jgi:hypothetical protein
VMGDAGRKRRDPNVGYNCVSICNTG